MEEVKFISLNVTWQRVLAFVWETEPYCVLPEEKLAGKLKSLYKRLAYKMLSLKVL